MNKSVCKQATIHRPWSWFCHEPNDLEKLQSGVSNKSNKILYLLSHIYSYIMRIQHLSSSPSSLLQLLKWIVHLFAHSHHISRVMQWKKVLTDRHKCTDKPIQGSQPTMRIRRHWTTKSTQGRLFRCSHICHFHIVIDALSIRGAWANHFPVNVLKSILLKQ